MLFANLTILLLFILSTPILMLLAIDKGKTLTNIQNSWQKTLITLTRQLFLTKPY